MALEPLQPPRARHALQARPVPLTGEPGEMPHRPAAGHREAAHIRHRAGHIPSGDLPCGHPPAAPPGGQHQGTAAIGGHRAHLGQVRQAAAIRCHRRSRLDTPAHDVAHDQPHPTARQRDDVVPVTTYGALLRSRPVDRCRFQRRRRRKPIGEQTPLQREGDALLSCKEAGVVERDRCAVGDLLAHLPVGLVEDTTAHRCDEADGARLAPPDRPGRGDPANLRLVSRRNRNVIGPAADQRSQRSICG